MSDLEIEVWQITPREGDDPNQDRWRWGVQESGVPGMDVWGHARDEEEARAFALATVRRMMRHP